VTKVKKKKIMWVEFLLIKNSYFVPFLHIKNKSPKLDSIN